MCHAFRTGFVFSLLPAWSSQMFVRNTGVVPALGHTAHLGLQGLKLKGRCPLSLLGPAVALGPGGAGLGIVLGRAGVGGGELRHRGPALEFSDFVTPRPTLNPSVSLLTCVSFGPSALRCDAGGGLVIPNDGLWLGLQGWVSRAGSPGLGPFCILAPRGACPSSCPGLV